MRSIGEAPDPRFCARGSMRCAMKVKDLQRAHFGAELEAETTRRARDFDARHAGRDR